MFRERFDRHKVQDGYLIPEYFREEIERVYKEQIEEIRSLKKQLKAKKVGLVRRNRFIV